MQEIDSQRNSRRAAYLILVLLLLFLLWLFRGALFVSGDPDPVPRTFGARSLERYSTIVALPLPDFPGEDAAASALLAQWAESGASAVALTMSAWFTGSGGGRLEWDTAEMGRASEALLRIRDAGLQGVLCPVILPEGTDDVEEPGISPAALAEWMLAIDDAAEDGGAAAVLFPQSVSHSGADQRGFGRHSTASRFKGSICRQVSAADGSMDVGEETEFISATLDAGLDAAGTDRRLTALARSAHRRVIFSVGSQRARLHASLAAFHGKSPERAASAWPESFKITSALVSAPWLQAVVVDSRAFDDAALRDHARRLFRDVALQRGTGLRRPELREAR